MNELNKRDFLVLFNTCNEISKKVFNKLGLLCATFCKNYAVVFEKLSREEIEINCVPEIVKGNGTLEQYELLSKWKSEQLGVKLDKHIVYIPSTKDLPVFIVSPDIYLVLNGIIFNVSEQDYLSAI